MPTDRYEESYEDSIPKTKVQSKTSLIVRINQLEDEAVIATKSLQELEERFIRLASVIGIED